MVLYVSDKNSVDNKPVFYLLWSSICTASRLCLLSVLPPQSRQKAGREKSLESRPWMSKGIYSMPHSVMLSLQNQEGGVGLACSHCSECSWASFCLPEVLSDCLWIAFSFLAYPFSLIKLLSQPMNSLVFAFLTFLFTALYHWLGKWPSCVVLSLLAGVSPSLVSRVENKQQNTCINSLFCLPPLLMFFNLW